MSRPAEGILVIRRFTAACVVALAAIGTIGLATPAQASSAGSFLSQINAERARAGRAPLVHRPDLAALALRHAQEMASQNSLHHNANLTAQVANWRAVGENVGMGGNTRVLHTAFMNSPAHRANILDKDFTEIGLGVTSDARGVMWVTEVFRQPMRATASAVTRKIAAPVASASRASTRKRPAVKPAANKSAAVRWATRRTGSTGRAAGAPSWLTQMSQAAASLAAPANGALPQAVDYLRVVAR